MRLKLIFVLNREACHQVAMGVNPWLPAATASQFKTKISLTSMPRRGALRPFIVLVLRHINNSNNL